MRSVRRSGTLAAVLTPQGAARQIAAWEGWFGTPLIVAPASLIPAEQRAAYPISPVPGGRILDGRTRFSAMRQCGCSMTPPYRMVTEQRAAARLLIFVGHHDRAVQILGDSVPYSRDLIALLRIGPDDVSELIAVRKLMRRRVRGKARAAPRRALDVVERLRLLRHRAAEDGFPLEVVHLDDCLGEWLYA